MYHSSVVVSIEVFRDLYHVIGLKFLNVESFGVTKISL
jgi:hypothetical protein